MWRLKPGHLILEVLLLAVPTLLIRLINLGHPPAFDELYHVLAARSFAADGTLTVGDGAYTRASLFTMLVGMLFRGFGESLEVARLPSVVAGTLWVLAVFLLVRRVAGSTAAWIAGLMFSLAPGALHLSQFCRFYALQGLLFWLGAAGVYLLLTGPPASRSRLMALTAGASVAFGVALYLQPTTLIGLGGVLTWGTALAGWRSLQAGQIRYPRGTFLAALALLVALMTAAANTGYGSRAIELYRWSALWNIAARDDFRFYHYLMLQQYPTFWTLLPFGALAAVIFRPVAATFFFTVFALSFLLHSFAGMKSERYLYYAMPFFFALWGVGIAGALPPIYRRLEQLAARLSAPLPTSVRRTLPSLVLALAVLFLVGGNGAFPWVVHAVRAGSFQFMAQGREQWAEAAARLRPELETAAVVISSQELAALYFLERVDVVLSPSRLHELPTRAEFAVDPRTGRPVISSGASLEALIGCQPSGLYITGLGEWRRPEEVPGSAVALLAARTERIELPPSWRIVAYRWQNSDTSANDCTVLSERLATTGHSEGQ